MHEFEPVKTATSALASFSDQIADIVSAVAPSVVQVHGRRRPASGLVYQPDVVLTTARSLGGREEGLRVRRHDGQLLDAELAGWDPATTLAVLRVPGLDAATLAPTETAPRVGNVAIAVGRSWSNAVTASAGIVAVIGGPLPTGPRRAIPEVIRITAPMHDGFGGGALLDASGRLIGVTTASSIRGLGVVIPAPIAWRTAASVLEHGSPKRGYLGLAGQQVQLPERQRGTDGRERGVLVIGFHAGSPAEAAGIMVGDVLLAFDGQPVESPDDLLERLSATSAGRSVVLTVLRGTTLVSATVTVGERPVP
jgi:S1-C subfamily serine protease